MQNKELAAYIAQHQLVAVMNTTKWNELISELTADPAYEPRVRIKLLFDDENTGGFSPVWWHLVEEQGFEYIEWLEINPIKEEQLGRLVAPRKKDYTAFIQQGLDKHAIPYELSNGIFRITGYLRTR
ncbi:DUF6678 family protein [Cesiribacter andamanensis]|uniref:Uncharacterized protein n=1 Tax=Cesiribacter andamanensis AMV16 TaxID=1279009 RepID=M7MZQ2_9BACT|nr:DUF6678 family protein [Cesiribacter andamanensis]EMR01908.1 hypothetical protein ADICEAN_02977 [Cesiribacter andamanensis AMV16]